jgi:hypothetical protein
MYVFKYAERRVGDGDEPWSIRQTGIYHRQSAAVPDSVFVVLHPLYTSCADVRLRESLGDKSSRESLIPQPNDIHILMMTTYLSSWRDYLLYFEDGVQKLVSSPMTCLVYANERKSLDILGLSIKVNDQLQAEQLNQVRYMESWVAPVVPILEAYLEILDGLLRLNETRSNKILVPQTRKEATECSLRNMIRECQAYMRNAKFLADRLTSMSQLISDGLALKSQYASQEQNVHLTALSEATMRDSATIRVITVATLIFLPTTFVSVSQLRLHRTRTLTDYCDRRCSVQESSILRQTTNLRSHRSSGSCGQ